MATEAGKCYYKENSKSPTSIAFKSIVDKIVDKCNEIKGPDDMNIS